MTKTPHHPLPLPLWATVGLVTALVIGLSGCGSPQPWERADPTEAARALLVALAFGDHATAWELLDDPTRAALKARADALRALPGAVERAPSALLNPGHVPYSATELRSVEAVDTSPEAATVRVTLHDGRAFDLALRRADGRWRVTLPPPPAPLSPQAP